MKTQSRIGGFVEKHGGDSALAWESVNADFRKGTKAESLKQ